MLISVPIPKTPASSFHDSLLTVFGQYLPIHYSTYPVSSSRINRGKLLYTHFDLWRRILIDYLANSCGYSDYPGTKPCGIFLTNPDWLIRLAQRLNGSRFAQFCKALRDAHHDTAALQKCLTITAQPMIIEIYFPLSRGELL